MSAIPGGLEAEHPNDLRGTSKRFRCSSLPTCSVTKTLMLAYATLIAPPPPGAFEFPALVCDGLHGREMVAYSLPGGGGVQWHFKAKHGVELPGTTIAHFELLHMFITGRKNLGSETGFWG